MKLYKPIYVCDKCQTQFDDSLQVRLFAGSVTDGEGEKFYIEDDIENQEYKMYCLSCIASVLNFDQNETHVPDLKKIDDIKEEKKIDNIKEETIKVEIPPIK